MKNIDKGMIPDSIIALLKVLENAGFEVFIVGGAIRDLLLGKAPNEFDLASNARPKEIESLFDFTKPIGRQFGTMLVRSGDHYCEVTTYRTEGQYSDSRHPDSVEFSDSIESDLMRRDFTMNATKTIAKVFDIGDVVQHQSWGTGVIQASSGDGDSLMYTIQFSGIKKTVLAKFAPLEQAT